jgi:hypothetical protein
MSAATLHVAGLEDLQLVLLLTDLELNNPLQIALSEVCHLDVILRLPLRIFEDINRATKEGCLNNLPEKVRLWVRLCSAVPNLPKLSTLRFWIDHDKSKTWTVVNERAFLAPLDTIAAVRPELEITVNLPLLHPKLESWERHFVTYSSRVLVQVCATSVTFQYSLKEIGALKTVWKRHRERREKCGNLELM